MSTRYTRAEVANYDAQERVLASPDLFQDWFGGELADADAQLELPAVVREEVTAEDFAETPVAQLYMLMVDPGQKPQTRLAAIDAIAGRYLAAKDDFVRQLALEAMGDRRAA